MNGVGRLVTGMALVACLAAALAGAAPPAVQPGVISLVPGATETLFALGLGDRVLAVSSFDTWPPEVLALPRVGALLDPDLERILSMRPRLVVIDPAHASLAAQLHAAGIATIAWPTGSVDDILHGTEALAEALGAPAAGQALASTLRRELDAVAATPPPTPPRVLLVFGRRPGGFSELYVSGGVGFLHELVELAGGSNVFGELALPSFRASLEVLLASPPDVVVEASSNGDQATLQREWQTLPGFATVRVVALDPARALVPGPRIVDTARILQQAFARHR